MSPQRLIIFLLVLGGCVQQTSKPTTGPAPLICPECPTIICPECPPVVECPPSPEPPEPLPCPEPGAPSPPYDMVDYVIYPGSTIIVPGKPFDAVGFNKWSEKMTKLGVWNCDNITISKVDNGTVTFNSQMPQWSHHVNPNCTVRAYRHNADLIMIGMQWPLDSDGYYMTPDIPEVTLDTRMMKVMWLLMKDGPYRITGR